MAGVESIPDIAVREGRRSPSNFWSGGGGDFGTYKEGKWHHDDFYTLRKGSRGSDFQLYNTEAAVMFAVQPLEHVRGKDLISGGLGDP